MAVLYNAAKVAAASTSFRAAFLLAKAADQYGAISLVVDSNTLVESYQVPESLGPLAARGAELVVEVPVRFDKDVTNVVYEKAVGIPLEAINDDQLGLYKNQIDGLSVAAKNHPDFLIADVLVAGFTTAKSYDGVAIFSDSHPIDGTTQSNLVSGALSSTTFGQAEAKLDGMTDYYGKPLRLRRFGGERILIVGPSNRATAKSIVEIATTTSGAGNPYYQSARVVVEESFAGAHAAKWMLVQGGGVAPLIVRQNREPTSIQVIDAPDSYDVIYNNRVLAKARWRGAVAGLFYQAAVGSTGS